MDKQLKEFAEKFELLAKQRAEIYGKLVIKDEENMAPDKGALTNLDRESIKVYREMLVRIDGELEALTSREILKYEKMLVNGLQPWETTLGTVVVDE